MGGPNFTSVETLLNFNNQNSNQLNNSKMSGNAFCASMDSMNSVMTSYTEGGNMAAVKAGHMPTDQNLRTSSGSAVKVASDLDDVCGGKKRQVTQIDELAEALGKLDLDKGLWSRLADMVRSSEAEVRYNGIHGLRMQLSVMGDIPIQDVVDTGVVPDLMKMIGHDAANQNLQFEVGWILTNIASGTRVQTQTIVEAGGIDKLILLLQSNIEEIRVQGLWGLANIAGDQAAYRNAILSHPTALQDIIATCECATQVESIRTGVWCISNICRGKPRPSFSSVKLALPYLASSVLHSNDLHIIRDACWALDGIGESIPGVDGILKSGIVQHLVALLSHHEHLVQRPALRVLGQIATGTAEQTQAIINHNVIPSLVRLLGSPLQPLRKDSCWTISNICAGTPEQIQQLIDENVFQFLVQTYRNDEDVQVRMEAAWAIVNAFTTLIPDQLEYLINVGCLSAICETLICDNARILRVVLTSLKNLLTFGATKAIELGMACNPVLQQIIAYGTQDKLLYLHSSAEQGGHYELWTESGTILQSYFT